MWLSRPEIHPESVRGGCDVIRQAPEGDCVANLEVAREAKAVRAVVERRAGWDDRCPYRIVTRRMRGAHTRWWTQERADVELYVIPFDRRSGHHHIRQMEVVMTHLHLHHRLRTILVARRKRDGIHIGELQAVPIRCRDVYLASLLGICISRTALFSRNPQHVLVRVDWIKVQPSVCEVRQIYALGPSSHAPVEGQDGISLIRILKRPV